MLAEIVCWRGVECVAIINNGLKHVSATAAVLVIAGSGLRTRRPSDSGSPERIALRPDLWYLGATCCRLRWAILVFCRRCVCAGGASLYPRRMRDAIAAAGSDVVF